MVNFRESVGSTAICAAILTAIGFLVAISSAVELLPAVVAVVFFCFTPCLVLAVALFGEMDESDKGKRSNFEGTTWFLVILFLLALCLSLIGGLPSLLRWRYSSDHFTAALGGFLTILVFMIAFYLIVDGGHTLKGSGNAIRQVSGWLAVVSAVVYMGLVIYNAMKEVPLLVNPLTAVAKTSMIAFSLINLSFLWWILSQKPKEKVEKKEAPKEEAPEEEAPEEEVAVEERE